MMCLARSQDAPRGEMVLTVPIEAQLLKICPRGPAQQMKAKIDVEFGAKTQLRHGAQPVFGSYIS